MQTVTARNVRFWDGKVKWKIIMAKYSAEYVQKKLEQELDAHFVSVEDVSDGCGAKFIAVIVSPKFADKPLLERHRMVNSILEEEMKVIHAFSQKTLTPEQWQKQQKINSS